VVARYLGWTLAAPVPPVIEALGLVGTDETVRRLTPLIRTWPADGAYVRAVDALDVLPAR